MGNQIAAVVTKIHELSGEASVSNAVVREISVTGIPRIAPSEESTDVTDAALLESVSQDLKVGDWVLVVQRGDEDIPVILGRIVNSVQNLPHRDDDTRDEAESELSERMVMNAKGEMVISCGAASIVLRKDGRIVIRGKDITSRATRNNRLKGGTVRIN